jgi:putative endonuclease
MPFDFAPAPSRCSRSIRGRTNCLAGHAAEDAVARVYQDRGIPICDRNWRGSGGEIDLIGRQGNDVIFVEVKSSRTHDLAASHMTQAQVARIFATVDEFLAGEPKGLMTDIRIDLALVDGHGRVEIIENAFAG